jgi:hypothetical protein
MYQSRAGMWRRNMKVCVAGVDTETPKNNQNDASIIQCLSDGLPTILRQCKLHPLPSLLQELRADAGEKRKLRQSHHILPQDIISPDTIQQLKNGSNNKQQQT